MGIKRVYLDYAATTPMAIDVQIAIRSYEREIFGTPSSVYEFAIQARKAIDDSREIIVHSLKIESVGILFTESGTETDNLDIQGVDVNFLIFLIHF